MLEAVNPASQGQPNLPAQSRTVPNEVSWAKFSSICVQTRSTVRSATLLPIDNAAGTVNVRGTLANTGNVQVFDGTGNWFLFGGTIEMGTLNLTGDEIVDIRLPAGVTAITPRQPSQPGRRAAGRPPGTRR